MRFTGYMLLFPGMALWFSGCNSASESPEWHANMSVNSPVAEGAGWSASSSGRMQLYWTDPPGSEASVRLEVRDLSTEYSWERTVARGQETLELADLKSATEYDFSISACEGETCAEAVSGGTTRGETAEEVWQLLGSGNRIDSIVNIVADSNAKAHAFVYGPDAPEALQGRIQLYYGAMGGYGGSLSVATSNRAADPEDESSYSDFTSFVGSSGVIQPDTEAPLISWIGTGQGVPLTEAMGGGVRLFFEARGADGKTRILSLDSQDGYAGMDFHAGAATFCSMAAEYSMGGGCHPTVEIGVEGDAVLPAEGLQNVRQHKVGVKTLTDWRWDGAVDSFMVLTTGAVDGCSDSQKNHGYARFDGTHWQVQYESTGCPKLFGGVQAMAPLDLGNGQFKMQFGNPDETDGRLGDGLPFLGPKRLIYGEPTRTGDPEVMEFEDWDEVGEARNITFLWPSGDVMDATEEGYIDDFVLLTPTQDRTHQVQFVVLTDGTRMPFTSVAILRNP